MKPSKYKKNSYKKWPHILTIVFHAWILRNVPGSFYFTGWRRTKDKSTEKKIFSCTIELNVNIVYLDLPTYSLPYFFSFSRALSNDTLFPSLSFSLFLSLFSLSLSLSLILFPLDLHAKTCYLRTWVYNLLKMVSPKNKPHILSHIKNLSSFASHIRTQR